MNLHPALFAHAASALISSVWEGILLAAAIGLCLQFVPRTTARLRFTVWTVAFIVLAALPFLNIALTGSAATDTTPTAAPHLQLDPVWSYGFAALWLAAVLIRSAHLAMQAVKLRSLWSSAVPLSTDLLPELPLGRVELCISTELDRPGVIGFFAPRILIPAWLFDQLSPGELHQIVLHELEHLRRRDDWINLIQKIGLVVLPLNPALLWIDRRLATERELACDDGVLSRTHAPRAYATCLTTLAERRLNHKCHNQLTVLALGAVEAVRRSDFTRRIESILGFGWRSSLNPATARALSTLLVAGILGAAATLAHAPQLVSFTAATPAPSVAAMMPSAMMPSAHAVRTNQIPAAKFENAVFHPLPAIGNSPVPRPAKLKLKAKRHSVTPAVQIDAVYSETIQRQERRWTVLASWHQSVPQPVLVTLPDGRTFLATYAADPNGNSNRAGWLIIQL